MYNIGRVFMFRVPEDNDLLEYLNAFALENKIDTAWVNVIGSLKDIELGYYDTFAEEYLINRFNGFYELVAGVGNISLRDGKPFTHLHVVIGDRTGRAYTGHLIKAKVYVAEAFIVEILGEPKLVRERVGRKLWLWKPYRLEEFK